VREKALVCVILAAIAASSYGQSDLSMGASAEAALAVPVSLGVEPFLKATGSLTAPLTDELSALADASARLGYGVPGQGFTYFGYAAADFSYRSGTLFGKLGATSTAEGDSTGSLPDLTVASDAEVTLDFSLFTLSFSPTLRWKQSDTQRRLEGEGAFSSIVSAGDQALLRARLEGGVGFPEGGTPEWFAAASAGVSFYPQAPLVLSIDAGVKKSFAANSLAQTIDGTVVTIPNANAFAEAFLAFELSASLGRDLRLGVLAPVRYRMADHGAVQGTAILPGNEWLFSVSPAVSLELALSSRFSLKATCGADLPFSNSAYLEQRVAYLTVESIFSIE
jgi:hypothetical protein